ncbi:MAG: helix-turn-helix transcriptional regulator [Lachnospiraceae bacterium]|nr:helix-turn-helix transcriptional regulator [Lachnospiraceae bacterium]
MVPRPADSVPLIFTSNPLSPFQCPHQYSLPDGIITRTVFPEIPPRVEYALSELGESMRPIIKSMEKWGLEYKQGLE